MNEVRLRALAKGLATMVPGVGALACRGSGGTVSARYCYGVWLRHLVMLAAAGLPTEPDSVAELGPGDSFGIGLAAMLSGANRYYALDARPHARSERNLAVFEELHALFGARAPIPDEAEFPHVRPRLPSYAFPAVILTTERLRRTLQANRIAAIRSALQGNAASSTVAIGYAAPWNDAVVIRPGALDLVVSQAVLEHVEDVPGTYHALHRWLRPNGVMSHAIDFKSHGLTRTWNGHWTVPDAMWTVVHGRRPYLINRLPRSAHIRAMTELGFRIVTDLSTDAPPLDRRRLAPRFASLTDTDLRTDGTFVQAIR